MIMCRICSCFWVYPSPLITWTLLFSMVLNLLYMLCVTTVYLMYQLYLSGLVCEETVMES